VAVGKLSCWIAILVFAGTFLGCIPNNFIAVNTGNKLGELKSLTSLYDTKQLLFGEIRFSSGMHDLTFLHDMA
jgi:hypothetical protein